MQITKHADAVSWAGSCCPRQHRMVSQHRSGTQGAIYTAASSIASRQYQGAIVLYRNSVAA
eukprot:404120-Rhodomonas_salina.2